MTQTDPPRSFDEVRAATGFAPDLDEAATNGARSRDGQLTKPPGALGRLEDLVFWLAAVQGSARPALERVKITVFAGNHGITARGVSAFPSAVTSQMVQNFGVGGAAINQLAGLVDADLEVVALDLERPTRCFTQGPAMSEAECMAAFARGFAAVTADLDLFVAGEMGIGNTTSAAALCALLWGGAGIDWAGPGTGLDPKGVHRKAAVIDEAIALHREAVLDDPLGALAAVGGREIAAMAGAMLAARLQGVPLLLDGFVAGAAAAVLSRLDPRLLDHACAGHRSAEPGHDRLLRHLGLEPLLDLGMRLGEGSGAAVAIAIARAALACHNGMATFESAGVATRGSER